MKNRAAILVLLAIFGAACSAGAPPVVVMLGDSTMLCSKNADGHKLTQLVAAGLADHWKGLAPIVVNSGVGGDTAKGGLARLDKDVLAHKPSLVTISFGLNDTGHLTTEEFMASLEGIVGRIRSESKAKILLITSTPFDNALHAWKDKFPEGLDEFMDANFCERMRELAKRENIGFCDLHAKFEERFAQDPPLLRKVIMPDGVHLTDEGNALAAAYLVPAIAAALR